MLTRAIAFLVVLAAPVMARQFDIRALGARCDGRTDDAPKVQAALDRLAPGDVLVMSCRAGIGSAGLTIRERRNLTVRGVNGGGFRALAPAAHAAQGFSPVMFLVQRCTRCTIESLYFDMNHVPEAAIGLDRCVETAFRRNEVVDTGYPANAAIVATGNRQGSYTGNHVLRTGRDAKDVARGMWLGNGDGVEVEFRPEISGNTVEDASGSGIVIYARGASVTGNTVARCFHGAGLKLITYDLPGAPPGMQNRVADNTLTANGYHGIQVERTEGGVRIERNRLEGNAIAGLYSSGGTFTGEVVDNTFSGNKEAGVYLYMASGVIIRNNTFESGPSGTQGHGVLLEAIEGGSIRGVGISGNDIWNQQWDGVSVRARGGELSGLNIEGNSFGGKTPEGVHIEDRTNRTTGRISLGANCFDRQLGRALADQRFAALRAPASGNCAPIAKKEGRPK